mmetsp:Transcript_8035/g.35736  ORF Transcript_8035/g.35736 Transcript_8035/m.35736 type:complete len:94 (+) Transcript_8035:359-640(+)
MRNASLRKQFGAWVLSEHLGALHSWFIRAHQYGQEIAMRFSTRTLVLEQHLPRLRFTGQDHETTCQKAGSGRLHQSFRNPPENIEEPPVQLLK